MICLNVNRHTEFIISVLIVFFFYDKGNRADALTDGSSTVGHGQLQHSFADALPTLIESEGKERMRKGKGQERARKGKGLPALSLIGRNANFTPIFFERMVLPRLSQPITAVI